MAETILALAAAVGSAAPSASTLSMISAGLGAAGTLYGGVQAQAGADFESRQLQAKGDEEKAISQREAAQARREKELTQSRIQAVAAASGGGVNDDSITAIMEGVEQQGDYNSMLALYQGDSSKNKMYASAANRKQEGKSALIGSVLSAGGSLYSKRR